LRTVAIAEEEAGRKLERYLFKYLNGAPKPLIYKLLRKKSFRVNGINATGNEMLNGGDILSIYLSDETLNKFAIKTNPNASNIPIEIIYEDENLIVCDKPAGLLTHPGPDGDNDTLINRVLGHAGHFGGTFSPVLCNRLDRNTSGAVVAAKNLKTARAVSEEFRERAADRIYLAIVKGEVTKPERLEDFYFKDAGSNIGMVTKHPAGKKIITEYRPLHSRGGYSLIEVNLHTGKSHQIRVHLQNAGHPVLGDLKYGDKSVNTRLYNDHKISGMLLHAWKVRFNGLNGEFSYLNGRAFTAGPPDNFIRAMQKLGLKME